MTTPVLTLNQMLDDCELRILTAAKHTRESMREAITYAHGMAHGYYLASGASGPEFSLASDRIRDIADLAERQFEMGLEQTEKAA